MTAKTAKSKAPRILELSIELEYLTPRIWRRFWVMDSITMSELHEIIQVTMGWMNSHLFMFQGTGLVIAEPSPYEDDDWGDNQFKDARKTKISTILKDPGDSLDYQYDFGDSWDHTLRFERVVPKKEVLFELPRCIAGENACPPEDCGGFPGFESLKKVIADPDGEEYLDMIFWLDNYYPNYDPAEFSLGAVNKILKIGASEYFKLMAQMYG